MPKPALAQQDGHNRNVTQGFTTCWQMVALMVTTHAHTDPNISQGQLVLQEKFYPGLTSDLNCRLLLLFPPRLLHNYILHPDHQQVIFITILHIYTK